MKDIVPPPDRHPTRIAHPGPPMTVTPGCVRGIFGQLRCRFEARYDSTMPDHVTAVRGTNNPDMIEAVKDRRYVRDVCVACGKTIERDQ